MEKCIQSNKMEFLKCIYNIVNISWGALFIFFLVSCKSEAPNNDAYFEEKIAALEGKLAEEKKFVNLLNDEMSLVNQTLDSLSEVYGIPINDSDDEVMVDRIDAMNKFIENSQDKIKKLENKVLELDDSSQVALLNKIITNLKKEIYSSRLTIEKYKIRHDSLLLEIQNVNGQVNDLQEVNDSLAQDGQKTNRINEELTSRLSFLNNQILEKQAEYNLILQQINEERSSFIAAKEKFAAEMDSIVLKSNEEKGLIYYDLGMDLLKQFDETKNGVLGTRKKVRSDILLKAYDNLRKACLAGHPNASVVIRMLLTNSNYSKNIQIDRKNFEISHCGI